MLGHYAVEIREGDNCDGALLRSFNLPIAENMVTSNGHWIPGADLPTGLDDEDAFQIWYAINEGSWPCGNDGLPSFASDELTDEDDNIRAVWYARRVQA